MNKKENKLKKYLNYLIIWIRKKVLAANCKGVIVNLSGGIDSSVVSLIAQKSFPKNHLTVILPCGFKNSDENYAKLLVKTHNLNSININLTSTYNDLIKKIFFYKKNKINNHILANIKPRLRMTMIYSLAKINNYLVLGTTNADEWYLGYFTKYGDGAADLAPIIFLLKKDIIILSKILKVNNEIIKRKPESGLFYNLFDEDEFGFSYNILDNFLIGKNISNNYKKKIKNFHKISNHKRKKIIFPSKKFYNFFNKKK